MILHDIPDASDDVPQPPVDENGMPVVTVTASKPWYLNGWVQLAIAATALYWLSEQHKA